MALTDVKLTWFRAYEVPLKAVCTPTARMVVEFQGRDEATHEVKSWSKALEFTASDPTLDAAIREAEHLLRALKHLRSMAVVDDQAVFVDV